MNPETITETGTSAGRHERDKPPGYRAGRARGHEAGYEQVYDIDEIITRMPIPEESERLGIPAGTPVAEHIRTGYTATGKPVRVMISVVPGDTLILQYIIPT
jgi:hypothetical protein